MIIENHNKLGESPIWNYFNNKFYWVDIEYYKIKCIGDKDIEIFNLMKKPTSLHLIDSNQLFCTVEDGLGIYDFRNNSYNYLNTIDDSKVRFNDGKCDRNGLLHIGTMCRSKPRLSIGNIYTYKNKILEPIITNIGTSNGISFSKDNTMMYYSDTSKKSIYQYKNNESTLIKKYEGEGPDGSTIDSKDRYYSCLWGGSKIDIFDRCELIESINLDVKAPTCCCFGGQYMNKLFITSAAINGDKGYINILDRDIPGIKEHLISF